MRYFLSDTYRWSRYSSSIAALLTLVGGLLASEMLGCSKNLQRSEVVAIGLNEFESSSTDASEADSVDAAQVAEGMTTLEEILRVTAND